MYISTACVKHETIKESVEELALNGFKDIELSGGTKYYSGYEEDLLALKDRHDLNYLLHNYFPPPRQDLILNMASLNNDVYQRTLKHYEAAITLSKKLDCAKFGLHAGFFIDFTISEIGKSIARAELSDHDKAMKRFCDGFEHLKGISRGVELYLENNVMSLTNRKNFQGQRPFMMVDHEGYLELKSRIDFKLLLDVAHLNVSAHSLGFDFTDQLNKMMPLCDYVHLSDNDGLHDQSRCFSGDSQILDILKGYDFQNKTMTSETYGSMADIKLSQSMIRKVLGINE